MKNKKFKMFLSCSEFITRYLVIDDIDEHLEKNPDIDEDEFMDKVKIAKRTINWSHFSNVTSMGMKDRWKDYCNRFPGTVVFDSGGFQIFSGVVDISKINYSDVIDKYKYFGLKKGKDYGFSLDRPIKAFDYKMWKQYYDFTVGNAIKMKEELGDIIIPVLQSCDNKHVKQMLGDIGYAPAYALKLGAGVNSSGAERHITSMIDKTKMINKMMPDSKVFILGGGGPKHVVFTYLMGGDWTDASTWLTRATRASIILGLDSHQYVAMGIDKNRMNIGKVATSFDEVRANSLYERCTSYGDYILDFIDYKDWFAKLTTSAYYRAIHNAWTSFQQERTINELGSQEEVAKYYHDAWTRLPLKNTWTKILNLITDYKKTKQTSLTSLYS